VSVADLKKRWEYAQIIQDPKGYQGLFRKDIRRPDKGIAARPASKKGLIFRLRSGRHSLRYPQGAEFRYEAWLPQYANRRLYAQLLMLFAHNPVAFLIPCHRVIRKTGAIGGYRWGNWEEDPLSLLWESKKVVLSSIPGAL